MYRTIFVLVACLLVPAFAGATDSLPDPLKGVALEQHALPNGTKLVLSPDSSTPVVSVCSTYEAGSRRASRLPATAWIAELAMRSGGRSRDGQRAERIVASRGGTIESETLPHAVRFCTVVPSSELELALWIEAGRMTASTVSSSDVKQALRWAHDTLIQDRQRQPYAEGKERLQALSLQPLSGYQDAVFHDFNPEQPPTAEAVASFVNRYYRPDNAAIAIAGDFEPETALRLVTQELGALREPRVDSSETYQLPRQTTERYSAVVDDKTSTPGIYLGWAAAPKNAREHHALAVLAQILAAGESSLLHRELVNQRGVAHAVEAHFEPYDNLGLFSIFIRTSGTSNLDKLRALVDTRLRHLARTGPSVEELERARRQLLSDWLFRLQSSYRRAAWLSELERFGGAQRIHELVTKLNGVDAAEVRRAAATWLPVGRRSLVEVYPPKWYDPTQTPLPKYHLVNSGETLIGIARKHGVTLSALLSANGLGRGSTIFPGQKLKIPTGSAVRQKVHTIQKGDTLIGIAKRYGVSVRSLVSANGIRKNRIYAGQKLIIPSGGTKSAPQRKVYTVKKGDTLGGIAHRHGVSVRELTRANRIKRGKAIHPGQELVIP